MSEDKQSLMPARRALRMLMAMRGTTLTGVSNGELAQALGESAPNVSRMLQVLVDEGFATQLENGRYAPSIALLQIAQAHAEHIARAQARITEVQQRIAAGVQL